MSYLVASVSALWATMLAAVNRTEIRQLKIQIRTFTRCYDVIHLAGTDPARDSVIADVTHRPVSRIDEAAKLFPAETALAHVTHDYQYDPATKGTK